MEKPGNDTSASEAPEEGSPSPTDDATDPDPDALFDRLVAEGVLREDDNGVTTTQEFDDDHAVYYDSYVGVGDEEFHRSVAETFGLPDADAAAAVVAEQGIERTDLARYLALRSHLPDDVSAADLGVMDGMVAEVTPDTPVPDSVPDVTDDPASFVAEHDRAVVTVWKRFCEPCERMAAELPDAMAAAPEAMAFAGIDGEVATEFCAAHEVDAAPAFVAFEAGERRDTVTGRAVEDLRETLERFYD
ncbi:MULTISPECIES: thioredoxin family protein [Halorussus]|uniref:thioredoxin family protein n=1 Tax=Halorussus TaxID=1070314 RepID=UPI00209F994D|nr:thioredoxin family protein [Halorussus vallis]USZ75614.1 thioredoxin family protein [Halorussus vallis]